MNYLQLPAKDFIGLAKKLKDHYGLIVLERPVKIKMDKTKYSSGWDASQKTYLFSVIEKDGSKKTITIQNGDGSALYAVTKQQYNAWAGWKIVSEYKGWDLYRINSYMGQLAYKLNIISLMKDFNKFINFLQRIF